ncbi:MULTISPECIES: dethiobiotin synthase [Psychrobacter]|jgi:dethiobiotin synthetase|uniref:dethiobiotin synthase n=1 Tax=Psychrobacter TaxID=497 RepID=UPI000C34AC64|nr:MULTISPECIES: dethiobiotin synthase [Psychrobacter]MBA6243344.1 ATP-dependent dethiobiotin synthetase BioD [Psychrobacter sp. Urea-trap-18]MBA6286947.1 ATP-dependent dethiobiotin synthetase BioD [Psychrobacter sp. Urea-trap-16]MBA6317996.1 ATP-dependent dethiobiotin synthetase BioD [Psychrobacter sp. Urea-trap-20]MBA6333494.1 ATP-dependent dethiobiotin synthetase BioD [Psychrobacter sp. Urea-trap-19]PKG61880.1 dethiobiotin synthase [Psychrobacter sp. Choline-3u-12]|tara:strand:+ start:100 stop:813 length:714 start_codon:yes stop_codon:yes gene_type:complete
MSVLFVSGIDTDIGKTYATGLLAKALMQQGVNVITQKLVQTGISKQANGELSIADDILSHRKLMKIPLQHCDLDFTTCPYRYEKPASPHLSAALANEPLDPDIITRSTKTLQSDYDVVLLEGAGGLLVPITTELLTLDYIAEQDYPIILVTSGRLGSISHTLLSLEAIKSRGLTVHSVIYNHIHDDAEQTDAEIANSTIDFLQNYLARHYPEAHWLQIPYLKDNLVGNIETLPENFV